MHPGKEEEREEKEERKEEEKDYKTLALCSSHLSASGLVTPITMATLQRGSPAPDKGGHRERYGSLLMMVWYKSYRLTTTCVH